MEIFQGIRKRTSEATVFIFLLKNKGSINTNPLSLLQWSTGLIGILEGIVCEIVKIHSLVLQLMILCSLIHQWHAIGQGIVRLTVYGISLHYQSSIILRPLSRQLQLNPEVFVPIVRITCSSSNDRSFCHFT